MFDRRWRGCLALVLVAAAACSGDAGTTPTPPTPPTPPAPTAAAISKESGDGQTITIKTALTSPLAVKVTSTTGAAVPNAIVTWTVASGEGTLSTSSTPTDAQGLARTTWTLGPRAGGQTVIASVAGVQQTQTFSAQATAFYTMLVYMAADNDLSWFGVDDIDEMETVGSSDSVQVVVQAEFSPEQTRMEGCGPACFNRPNYNTFRYRVERGSARSGPDGQATDIGNKNMTSAQELAEFIAWGKQNYPAEKYVLVLWNHGGGYQGLIEDATSNGSGLMSLSTLRAGLLASNTVFDVIDFDMCLMAGAETLLTVDGLARYAVFSEELEPGEGDPYNRILVRLRGNPTQSAAAFAAGIVDDFTDSYLNTRNSVTKSAVDMSRLPPFSAALNGLASELDTNMAAHRTALSQAIPASQNYSFKYLRDLGDVLSQLRQRTTSPALQSRIDAVQASLAGGLVIRNRHYTGDQRQPVGRSTGLHVLLPSGGADDALPSAGPGSLAAYTGLYNTPWSTFLVKWLATSTTARYFDQGANQLQAAVVWDSAAVSRGADLDFWVFEPSGDLYIPFLGVVTPNGTFGGDSYDTRTWYEIYTTRRYIEVGRYEFLAELYMDPQNFRPRTSFQYRRSPGASWTDLYGANAPRLSKDKRWMDDQTPTWGEIVNGAYTDLVHMAYWEVGGSSQSSARLNVTVDPGGAPAAGRSPRMTAAQAQRVRELLADPAVRAHREAARVQARARAHGGRAATPFEAAADRGYRDAAARGRP